LPLQAGSSARPPAHAGAATGRLIDSGDGASSDAVRGEQVCGRAWQLC